jgi:hypothetical protein
MDFSVKSKTKEEGNRPWTSDRWKWKQNRAANFSGDSLSWKASPEWENTTYPKC